MTVIFTPCTALHHLEFHEVEVLSPEQRERWRAMTGLDPTHIVWERCIHCGLQVGKSVPAP